METAGEIRVAEATRERSSAAAHLFAGPGEMRARCRAHDWAATSLGPVDGWPAALRAAVRLSLDSGFPMCVYAGPDLVLVYNDGFVPALAGGWHAGALGHPVRELWGENWEQIAPEFARVLAGGPPVHAEDRKLVFQRDGRSEETFWTYALSPVRDDEGAVVAVHGVVTETTARVREEAALRASEAWRAFLAKLGDALRPLADPRQIQATATRMLLEWLDAGWCYYAEWDERGAFADVMQDATRAGLPSLAGRHDVSDVPEYLDFLRSGQAFAVGDFARFELLSPRVHAQFLALGFRSMVGAPIVSDGRLVTTLMVVDTAPREWPDDVVTLVREVADRTWTALVRARAAEARRESAERQDFLLALGDAMRAQPSSQAIIEVAARLLGERLQTSRALFAEFDETNGTFGVFHEWLADGAEPFPAMVQQEDFDGPILSDLQAGGTLRVDDAGDAPFARPDLAALAGVGIKAALSVPLIINGRMVATLSVHQHTARHWTDGEVALLEEVAERLWADLVRARTESALRRSEARYRTLVENVREYAIFLVDARGIVTEWTAGAARMKGYTAEEVLGRHISLFYAPEDVAAGEPERELAEAGATGRAEREGWRVRKGGERFWAREILTAVRDGEGALAGFTKVCHDLTEQRAAAVAAEHARAMVARNALRRQLLQAEEDERRRLARELHDELGQHLTALGLGLQSLSDVAPPGSEVDRRAERLRALVGTMGRELHAVAVRLRPKSLDDFGLEAALAAHAQEWSRQSGVAVDVHASPQAERLPAVIEGAIYRIVQEALTNVARHGEARHVSVLVERRDGHVHAIVEDDGRGFDSSANDAPGAPRGLGLLGIRERAAQLGGMADVESTPGAGTTIFVRIPIAVPGAALGGTRDDGSPSDEGDDDERA